DDLGGQDLVEDLHHLGRVGVVVLGHRAAVHLLPCAVAYRGHVDTETVVRHGCFAPSSRAFSGSSCPEGEAQQLPDGGPVKHRLAEFACWRFTMSGGLSSLETAALTRAFPGSGS